MTGQELKTKPNFFFMSSTFLPGSGSRSTSLRTAVITSFVLHCVTPSHKSFSSFFDHFFGGSDSPGRNGLKQSVDEFLKVYHKERSTGGILKCPKKHVKEVFFT